MKSIAAKQAAVAQALRTSEGRRAIAKIAIEPLRERRDYETVARRAFYVDPIADGQLPYYDKDPQITAYVVAEEGDSIQQIVKGDRVLVPLFEIRTWVGIPFTQVKERRYDVVNRIKQKTKSEVFRVEDRKAFALMSAAAPVANTTTVQRANFSIDTIIDTFAFIEQHDNKVSKLFMNAYDFAFFRKAGKDYFMPNITEELIRTGFQGKIFGADIYLTPEVEPGNIYLTAEAEFFGVCPVRTDITVLSADDNKNGRFGWTVLENLGFAITNPTMGLAKIVIQ